MTGRRRHERASAPGRTRALAAHLAWWLGSAAALVSAATALGVALRADPEQVPWTWVASVGQWLAPGDLAAFWPVSEQLSATTVEVAVHAFWAVLWCAVGLFVALVVRPPAPAQIPHLSEMYHTA